MARKSNIPNRQQQTKAQVLQLDRETNKVFQNGLISHQSGQLAQAKLAYQQVLLKQPKHFDAMHLLGVVAAQTMNPALAEELIGKAIEINSNSASAYSNRGNALKELNRLGEALESYEKAIALKPDYAEAFNNRGIVLHELKLLEDALVNYGKAIAIKPDYAEAFYNRGNALKELKRLSDAIANYQEAIALQPIYVEAFINRGIVLQELNLLEHALVSYDKAIALKPDCAEAFYNRGIALQDLKRLDEAIESYEKAIAFNPIYAEAFNNRGNVLKDIKRFDDAISSFERAISQKPDYAEAFNNCGNVLKELNRLDDALANYDRAIMLEPDFAEVYCNRGIVLQELKRLDDALVSYDKAIALKPECKSFLGDKLHVQMHLCNWSAMPSQLQKLEAYVVEELGVTNPFAVLGLVDKPEFQLKVSKIYANEKHHAPSNLDKFKIRSLDGKIRIGYYSADFHSHATSFLMAELFEAHDAKTFEIYGFSFGPDRQDEMRSRVSGAFTYFFDVAKKSDREVAQISRALGIDIAIDLKGFTENSRMGIFAERCAPIQVNYLGYPGTLGAPYFDYIFADKTLIPQGSRQYYTEKIVYLPHSYQVNDSMRKISSKAFKKQDLGLPENGFVFCCFNNNYKILPATFDIWMRLLKAVDGSVLWLLADNPTAAKNLRKEAMARGVHADRLIFAPRIGLEDHLARHRVADLFIDTLPYNAHTTASDALWAGLPVLTQLGQSFAGRVAASLLLAMDLPELITNTQEEYEAKAIELVKSPFLLAEIKRKIQQNRLTSPLFNGRLFARHIEAAYSEIHKRYLNGENPDHIDLKVLVS